jgi:hypothetical protein
MSININIYFETHVMYLNRGGERGDMRIFYYNFRNFL